VVQASRASQPYRGGARPQTQALQAMLRGRTLGGFNPKDVERGVARMQRARQAWGKRAPRLVAAAAASASGAVVASATVGKMPGAMATVTLTSFPAGASVSVYNRSDFPAVPAVPSGAPTGLTAVFTDTVGSNGELAVTGLADETRYVAYYNSRYVSFGTPPAVTDMATQAELDAHTANTLLHPQQLGYVEKTDSFSTTSTSLVDVTGLAISGVVVGARPVRVWLGFANGFYSSVQGDIIYASVLRGSTVIGSYVVTQGVAGSSYPAAIPFHDNPAAGTYTYKVQVARFSGSGTVNVPAYGDPFYCYTTLRVEEVAA